jgi:hypothetical protein
MQYNLPEINGQLIRDLMRIIPIKIVTFPLYKDDFLLEWNSLPPQLQQSWIDISELLQLNGWKPPLGGPLR